MHTEYQDHLIKQMITVKASTCVLFSFILTATQIYTLEVRWFLYASVQVLNNHSLGIQSVFKRLSQNWQQEPKLFKPKWAAGSSMVNYRSDQSAKGYILFKEKECLCKLAVTDTVQCDKTCDSYEIPYQELQEAVIFPYASWCFWSCHSLGFAQVCLVCGGLVSAGC